jgi:alanyl-tRNA synthetase
MNARELKKLFTDFFVSKNHVEIPSASLVPDNDPTTLFISAGMHPLIPYLLGTPHPLGKNLVDVQKCIRTGDIDEVGDTFHHTFFEMLGNWSLGDYFKKGMIEFSIEFLNKVLNLPLERLAFSCFAGDTDAPKDEESTRLWQEQGVPIGRIAFLPKKNNWWERHRSLWPRFGNVLLD